MAKIRFETGQTVEFDGIPSPQDVEEVARSLGIKTSTPKPTNQAPKESTAQRFFGGVADITGGAKLTKATAELLGGDTTESTIRSALSSGQLVDQAKKFPLGDPRRRQLLEQAKGLSGQTSEQASKRIEDLPTKKQVAADAVQLAVTLGTVGLGSATAASAGGRVLQTGAKLGGLSAISGGAEAFGQGGGVQDIAKSSAISGGIGFGLGAGGQAISELAQYLTSPAVSEGLYNKALGITKKTIERGKSPSKMLLQEGVGGSKKSMLSQTNRISEESKKAVDLVLENSKRTHTSKTIIKQIEKELQSKFQNTLGADDIKKVVDGLPLNKLRTSTKINDKVLNNLRQELDNNFLGNAKWLGESTAEKTLGLKTASNVMRSIVQSADNSLPPIFERWSNAITSSRSLRSELAKPHALSNMLELLISLGVGGTTGGLSIEGLKNALVTYGAINAGQSAPVKTGVARGLQTLNRAGTSVLGQTARTGIQTLVPGVSSELSQ